MDIHIAGLTKIFKPNIAAVSDIYLDIVQGEFVYLIGETGSGKSTLMRVLSREVMPTRGQVYVGGENLRKLTGMKLAQYRRNIGVVFQDFKLLPNLTAWENIAFVLEVLGVGPSDVRELTDEAIARVDLWHRKDMLPEQLSGGEQQRISIARAIVCRPALFLADEPTGNLDPHTAERVINLLLSIHSMGTTVLIATHDQFLVNSYRQRVIELRQGRLVRDERQGRYYLNGNV